MTGEKPMYILLFIATLVVVYIDSFKESFTTEHIQKTAPVIALATSIIFILSVIVSALNN